MSLKIIIKYLNDYLLTTDVDIPNLSILKLGNDKSTATRLRFIFSELMLNCLKNASFISSSERKLKIRSVVNDERIEFTFSNTYYKRGGSSKKTSGHGVHLIQENIRAYNGQMIITANEDNYNTKITLPNFWYRFKNKK